MSTAYELAGSTPTDAISSLRFSPSGKRLAVASWDCTVRTYERSETDPSRPFSHIHTTEHRAPILDVCFGANDDTILCVGLDREVKLQLVHASHTEALVLSTHGAASNKLAYSKAHNILLSTSWDSTLHVHDLGETKRYIRIQLPAKPFAVSLTSTRAVIAMAERKVYVYELQALKEQLVQTGGTDSSQEIQQLEPWQHRESSLKFMTRAVSCMADGNGFATSSIEGRVGVEFFGMEENKEKMFAFKCHRQTVTAPIPPEEIPEGAEGGGGGDRKVDLVYPVNALAFHPEYLTVATGGGDGVVALWDAATKRRIRMYPKLGASVAAMDFSSDGKWLAVGVSAGFEDGREEEEVDPASVKIVVRELGEGEARGKAAK